MKNFTLLIVAVMAMSSFAIAGGSIAPVEEPAVVVEPAPVDDSGFYMGLAYSYVTAEVDDTEKGNAYTLLVGYNFNQYIAIEGRYGQTFGDMDVDDVSNTLGNCVGDCEREVTYASLYVKPQYPVTESFSIYALLGYGEVTARETSDDGFQWGLGANYMITENAGIFIDYTSLYNDDLDNVISSGNTFDSQITSTNIGFTYSF